MNIGCDWVREQLEDDLGRSLAVEAARDLDEHVAHCEACRRVRARQEMFARVFHELPRVSAPPDLLVQIEAEIERRASTPRRFRVLRFAAPIAATAIAATFLAIFVLHRARPDHVVLLREDVVCTSFADYELRDRLYKDNPFFSDTDPADAYYRILKEGWK
ncbi:MAG: hypothetical protein HY292_19960 [Planctomycetes bacterium]|nr:hypothetical protein [Planctomycetota bacterium]